MKNVRCTLMYTTRKSIQCDASSFKFSACEFVSVRLLEPSRPVSRITPLDARRVRQLRRGGRLLERPEADGEGAQRTDECVGLHEVLLVWHRVGVALVFGEAHFERLHESREEQEALLPRERLAQTAPLSCISVICVLLYQEKRPFTFYA